MGVVQIRQGDMFDGPSDLIVFPCSTSGSVTDFVAQRLRQHGIIVRPSRHIQLGDVEIHPFVGGDAIASFVAYAVSVADYSSSHDALREIATRLGEATRENDTVSTVSVPLLGTGAGGLNAATAVDALRSGFAANSSANATLVVSVVNRRHANQLSVDSECSFPNTGRNAVDVDDKPPRVFISYSHSEQNHVVWVKELGAFLRQNGVDARLDVWHLRPGMDLPQFMTNELTLADRVLIICDVPYAEKADGRFGGVGWETMIIQGDIARLPVQSRKYIAIVRSDDLNTGTPIYLRSKLGIHWTSQMDQKQLENKLLAELFDAVRAPPLGRKPASFAIVE